MKKGAPSELQIGTQPMFLKSDEGMGLMCHLVPSILGRGQNELSNKQAPIIFWYDQSCKKYFPF